MSTLLDIDFLRSKLSAEQIDELSLTLRMCLECGGSLQRAIDGEIVCGKCGRVWGFENVNESIPFPEEGGGNSHFEGHWQPGSSLCFLKGVGDPALQNSGRGGLMRVLALAPAHATDLGLRARFMKLITQMEDPPQLRKVLTRISLILDMAGLRENHQIADYAGKLARKIVAFALIAHIPVRKRIGDAIAQHAIKKFQLKVNLNACMLKSKEEDLKFIEWFEEATQKLKPTKAKVKKPRSSLLVK